MQQLLLSEFRLGNMLLPNRIVMSSLTRGRTTNADLAPTSLHATYYAQRASAGLIITESVKTSANAIGFINIPGIYSAAQIEGWKLVTDAVHHKNGRIFLQLSHSGSVSHPDLLNGDLPLGPSAINPQEKSFTPAGFKDTVTPRAYTVSEIKETIQEFKQAARNAQIAGFDGIELHAQIFTLIPQFLSKATNQRTDEYGGNIENRSRILFEIIDVLKEVFESKCIGIKLSPAAFNPGLIKPDEETIATYEYILGKLSNYDLAYIQIVGPSVPLAGTVIDAWHENYFLFFRKNYTGTLMTNLGFTKESANNILESGTADIVSFGAAFIANPDLPVRFAKNIPLAQADTNTFYSGDAAGYTDYPFAATN